MNWTFSLYILKRYKKFFHFPGVDVHCFYLQFTSLKQMKRKCFRGHLLIVLNFCMFAMYCITMFMVFKVLNLYFSFVKCD